jgi:hypothetical protein
VSRETLRRRHQGLQDTHTGTSQQQQNPSPQQEKELVQYIKEITKQGLPPTRTIIQNFASAVATSIVSTRWVSRFIARHKAELTSKWTVGMDRDRVKADNRDTYCHYFELLHAGIRQYNVEPRHIYNMDEKGFLVGITSRQKRVFSRQLWEQKRVTASLQDSSRELVTVLVTVCADGSSLDPAVIYEGKGELRSGWVHDVEAGRHRDFSTTSPTGWSNDDVGLAWLEQVFDRPTKRKAQSSYRILIVDGHGSHLTREFLSYCLANKILLCVLPPHSTHSLQPLDFVLSSPLSTAYSVRLSQHLQRSMGVLPVRKGAFFALFWDTYITSFMAANIYKAFEAKGVEPRDAGAVLKRFETPPQQQAGDTEIGEHGDGDSWRQVRKLFDAPVPNKPGVEAKRLSAALHSFQAKNEVVRLENEGLKQSFATKDKHKHKIKPLPLQQRKEFHSQAVFWSPSTIREAFVREDVERREKSSYNSRKKTRGS